MCQCTSKYHFLPFPLPLPLPIPTPNPISTSQSHFPSTAFPTSLTSPQSFLGTLLLFPLPSYFFSHFHSDFLSLPPPPFYFPYLFISFYTLHFHFSLQLPISISHIRFLPYFHFPFFFLSIYRSTFILILFPVLLLPPLFIPT